MRMDPSRMQTLEKSIPSYFHLSLELIWSSTLPGSFPVCPHILYDNIESINLISSTVGYNLVCTPLVYGVTAEIGLHLNLKSLLCPPLSSRTREVIRLRSAGGPRIIQR